MGTNDYYVRLVTSLDKFRETDFLCDTVLVTDDKRELKAHSVVLAAASSVFRTAFASAAERGPGPLQVNLREYESDIVEIALQFIYTGKLLLIPAMFSQKSEWSRLVCVLERLGLDLHLLDHCEKSFKEYVFGFCLGKNGYVGYLKVLFNSCYWNGVAFQHVKFTRATSENVFLRRLWLV